MCYSITVKPTKKHLASFLTFTIKRLNGIYRSATAVLKFMKKN